MSERQPKRPRPDPDPEFWLEKKESQAPTFTEVGGSPVSGLTLRNVLRGHKQHICGIAWSPDGRKLASPSEDKTVKIWDVEDETPLLTLKGHAGRVTAVAWSTQTKWIASSSDDNTVKVWDSLTGNTLFSTSGPGNSQSNLSWSKDGSLLGFYDFHDETVRVFNIANNGELIAQHQISSKIRTDASLPNDGWWFVLRQQNRLLLFDANKGESYVILDESFVIHSFAFSASSEELIMGCDDHTVRILNLTTGLQTILEGHTRRVLSVSLSHDGKLLASKGNEIIIWRTDRWEHLTQISEACSPYWPPRLAFNPISHKLASLGKQDTIIRIWELDEALLLSQAQESVNYTTAKLVLVGDSGVGKTGLGWRLAKGEFKEHSSTHGQQFWPIKELGLRRSDGTECEAVLWDLAGQHAYRQIHSIFLDNVAAALVLFDPSNRQEPLKGVQFWLEQLKGKGQLPPVVLVGARVDVSPPALSQEEVEQFCQRHGVRGGYVSTSAKSNEGVGALLERLKAQIPWDEMTATVTTVTFKRIKDYVLALKEKPDREGVLVSPAALREQLQASDPEWRFTDAEMLTAVGHLETHGYVAVLRSSAGDRHVLLAPELLVTLAASVVFLADKNPRELGAVSETELLRGAYPFEELAGLAPAESQVLLDAAILRFLKHNICFRETLNEENLLIFPALIKQKRPLHDDLPSTDDISYVVRGRVENLYASLVVLLGYTPSFTRINQWQNQAQYELGEGEICGFRLIEDRQGEIELVLYYGDRLPAVGRVKFQELFEQFLHQRDVSVKRFPPVVCAGGHQQKRATVVERVRERKAFMFCDECGGRVALPDFERPQAIGINASPWLQLEAAAARLRSAYEVQLTKVKGYRRDWAAPRCYVSRLPEQEARAKELTRDLREAGVYVVERPAQVRPEDFVVVLDTPAYQKAFCSSALADDEPLVRARLGRLQLISLALAGKAGPHDLEHCLPGSFRDETHYPVSLFDLVLNLYAIPLTHAGFAPLRQALHGQWEQTLAREKGDDSASPLRIFISYSHKDETFKDELVTMLAGLQRRRVVDAWQDRRIEAGDEWNTSIRDAMDDCDLALLLVSGDYLASRFIQEEEQPRLLERRREMRLRVIPIIVRDCLWRSEPVLKDLQALPANGEAVITFPKETGGRDRVWAEIAAVIEERAKIAGR